MAGIGIHARVHEMDDRVALDCLSQPRRRSGLKRFFQRMTEPVATPGEKAPCIPHLLMSCQVTGRPAGWASHAAGSVGEFLRLAVQASHLTVSLVDGIDCGKLGVEFRKVYATSYLLD